MEPWKRLSSRILHASRVGNLEEVSLQRPGSPEPVRFMQLACPDWVNVIPLTEAGEVLLIRQYRPGTDALCIEIPGGMVEPGEDPAVCAARELTEETGWVAARLEPIGMVEPNPAILTNRCHTFLATGCRPSGHTGFDPDEDIETFPAALSSVPGLIADGTIRHSLVVAAFYHLFVTRGGR